MRLPARRADVPAAGLCWHIVTPCGLTHICSCKCRKGVPGPSQSVNSAHQTAAGGWRPGQAVEWKSWARKASHGRAPLLCWPAQNSRGALRQAAAVVCRHSTPTGAPPTHLGLASSDCKHPPRCTLGLSSGSSLRIEKLETSVLADRGRPGIGTVGLTCVGPRLQTAEWRMPNADRR